MTDNEIIKALESCFIEGNCGDCPCHVNKPFSEACLENTVKLALDLINRQKAEIERLREVNIKQAVIIEEIGNTIYPLPFETVFDKAIKHAKAESIKEFLKKAKDLSYEIKRLVARRASVCG